MSLLSEQKNNKKQTKQKQNKKTKKQLIYWSIIIILYCLLINRIDKSGTLRSDRADTSLTSLNVEILFCNLKRSRIALSALIYTDVFNPPPPLPAAPPPP